MHINVPSPVLPGGGIGISTTIQNTGTFAPRKGFRTSYSIRGPGTANAWKQIADDGSEANELGGGKSQNERMDEKVAAPTTVGYYDIRACADYQGGVEESNENDNCKESLSVFEVKEGKPDFIVTNLWLREGTSFKQGTRVYPYCTVKNIGTVAPPRDMRIAYYINQNEYRDSDNVSISDMDPGREQTENVNNDNIKLGDKGTRTYRCCADYLGQVAESDESNNCATMTFVVKKK